MKDRLFSLFAICALGANLFSATEENTGWSTVQGTEQAFYIFDSNIDIILCPERTISLISLSIIPLGQMTTRSPFSIHPSIR